MEHPDRIHLKDLIIAADIGAFQSERGRTQRLRFNLDVELRQTAPDPDDHVDHILSYDVLTQAVETALADRRYNLVETLAEKIAAEVLAQPKAARVTVTVEKLDRGPGALGVTITRDASRLDVSRATAPVRVIVGRPTAVPDEATVILPQPRPCPCPRAAISDRSRCWNWIRRPGRWPVSWGWKLRRPAPSLRRPSAPGGR